jgi:hypothetical protein
MKRPVLALAALFTLLSCGDGEKESSTADYIPVLAFIQSQVAHVDSSLYSIVKLTIHDSTRTDTEYVRREDFRKVASDFLAIPDLTDSRIGKDYEQVRHYDESLNRVIVSYTPKNPDKADIQRQEVLITPGTAEGDKITSIIIERIRGDRNGYFQQNLLWRTDRSFQVVTMEKKPGQPETSRNVKVIWNEDPGE